MTDRTQTHIRRGKIVIVPDRWIGCITSAKTIRQRPSKLIGKVKRIVKGKVNGSRYKDRRDEAFCEGWQDEY